jgi:serine/threonine protein kinase
LCSGVKWQKSLLQAILYLGEINTTMQYDKFIGEAYQVKKTLERSMYSVLCLGEQITTAQAVMLKFWFSAHVRSQEEQESIRAEVERLQAVQHPYLLPVLEVSATESGVCLVSSYPPGGSLQEFMDQDLLTSLTIEDALQIIQQVGQALDALHKQGLTHGNLTPRAVFLSQPDNACLGECQLQSVLACISNYQPLLEGDTSCYLCMAPEQFSQPPDASSDQYALGCLGSARSTLLQKHQREQPVLLHELNAIIPVHVENAVLKALVKQPAGRYKSVQDFLAAFDQSSEPWLDEEDAWDQMTVPIIVEGTLMGEAMADSVANLDLVPPADQFWEDVNLRSMSLAGSGIVRVVSASPLPKTYPGLPPSQPAPRRRNLYLIVPLILLLLALVFAASRLLLFSSDFAYPPSVARVVTPTVTHLTPVLPSENPRGVAGIATVVISPTEPPALTVSPTPGATATPVTRVTPTPVAGSTTPTPVAAPVAEIMPFLNCISQEGNTDLAKFGYNNTKGSTLFIPLGTNNFVTPASMELPITFFSTGVQNEAFQIHFFSSSSAGISWTLNGVTATATGKSPLC